MAKREQTARRARVKKKAEQQRNRALKAAKREAKAAGKAPAKKAPAKKRPAKKAATK